MENSEKATDFVEHYEKARGRLLEIWEEFGLLETDAKERKSVFSKHLINLINQIVEEEEHVRRDLIEGIKKRQEELDMLCRELELPLYQPDVQQKLISKEKDLSEKVVYLRAEKDKRLQELADLLKQDQELCSILTASPFYLPRATTPTQKQISELKKHIEMLQTQKHQRESLFHRGRCRILNIIERLQVSPASQFECNVIMESEECFVPSAENMKLLQAFVDRLEKRLLENKSESVRLCACVEALWQDLGTPHKHRKAFMAENAGVRQECIVALQEEVNRCKVLKLQNAQQEAAMLQEQLESIYDKCYVGVDARKKFGQHHKDTSSTEYLEAVKEELCSMRNFFSDRQALIDRVKHYDDMWHLYLQFEKQASKPDRLFDKGWSLLKEEQERNRILKQLPKLENEIGEEIKEWEDSTDKQFRVLGREFEAWVEGRWVDLRERKENEKMMRHQHRQKQLEQESLYGSKSTTTPSKRILTPCKSSACKSRRVLQPPNYTNTPHHNGTPTKQPSLNIHPQSTTTTFLLSETIVSSHQIQQHHPEDTIAPLDMYDDFEIMLNEQVRSKTRSSMMPASEQQQ